MFCLHLQGFSLPAFILATCLVQFEPEVGGGMFLEIEFLPDYPKNLPLFEPQIQMILSCWNVMERNCAILT
jgi:hypothetical protein